MIDKRKIKFQPCPYCQRVDRLTLEGRSPAYFVICRVCGLTGPYGPTKEEAIENFNILPRKEKTDDNEKENR